MTVTTTFDTTSCGWSYPYLRQSVSSDMIVLFIDDQKGTVVHKGDGVWNLGLYRDDWAPASSKHWKHVESVTITNKL